MLNICGSAHVFLQRNHRYTLNTSGSSRDAAMVWGRRGIGGGGNAALNSARGELSRLYLHNFYLEGRHGHPEAHKEEAEEEEEELGLYVRPKMPSLIPPLYYPKDRHGHPDSHEA